MKLQFQSPEKVLSQSAAEQLLKIGEDFKMEILAARLKDLKNEF